jgi:polysaccharide export outer membrane protein
VQDPPKPAANPAADLPAADSPSMPVDPKSYRVGPEDVIAVRVWREPELSGQFVVRPDGRITLPLAGELNVSELTPEQVQAKVIELYSKFVNKPEVGVSLSRVGSKKYYLVGQVARAGMMPLVVPTTILEAINAAGGFQEFANKKKVTILRGTKILRFNYEEVINGKKMEQNILVENGDHIIVK